MTTRRFPSKVDAWLPLTLVAVIALQAYVIAVAVMRAARTVDILIPVAILLLAIVVMGALLRFTYYDVDRDFLTVRAGPVRWRVPLDSITAVEPTRSLVSSPALSLDRLRIRYGKRRQLLVSPRDKDGFLRALGHAATHDNG
jgi:hypothetical protein